MRIVEGSESETSERIDDSDTFRTGLSGRRKNHDGIPFSLGKHVDLGGNVFGIETVSPDSLRTTLLVLTRSARCIARGSPPSDKLVGST